MASEDGIEAGPLVGTAMAGAATNVAKASDVRIAIFFIKISLCELLKPMFDFIGSSGYRGIPPVVFSRDYRRRVSPTVATSLRLLRPRHRRSHLVSTMMARNSRKCGPKSLSANLVVRARDQKNFALIVPL